ncbi:homoserine O-succinyltransferase MetA [Aestuariivirga litoralis]|uniref:homoserine O-succinyltransferase MetA n=1 Tax=Aestuariivirga litoralis TaxID=2650924 RepID=UPI0018C62563|nr:homoserine O-succinyltransferase [Aestuariivirga litoralis]MBG1233855.1 homoserine O-succinyltransferase [Aestuariivirga litoralis]
MSRMIYSGSKSFQAPRLESRPWPQGHGGPVLEIGLVNNMPDSALLATERQFVNLVQNAAAGRSVRIKYFSLPSVPRSTLTQDRMRGQYRGLAELENSTLDALIVTGTEPKAPKLRDEPYWNEFKTLVDWAAENTKSTVWSCLAAHGAVLHMDAIQRRPLKEKCSGVYEGEVLAKDPLLQGFSAPLQICHSRWNTLDAGELSRAGYRVLSQSIFAGVDTFTKNVGSQFIFYHGHPEYDEASLLKEYRRDVTRFLNQERENYPGLPHGYFDAALEAGLRDFRSKAESRDVNATLENFPELAPRAGLAQDIGSTADQLYRNWINGLFESVSGETGMTAKA